MFLRPGTAAPSISPIRLIGPIMNVLVIGGGGREHALVWKLAQSPRVRTIFCAPGNGGIASQAMCLPIAVDDVNGLLATVEREDIDLTIVGPAEALAKAFLQRHGTPTATAVVGRLLNEALAVLDLHPMPVVIKADGLAAGKGVVVTTDRDEARGAVRAMMERRVFGAAGDSVLIEECLQGMEATCMAFCDGRSFVMMPAAQDHKRAEDGDRGPNTGGMGAYAPTPFVTDGIVAAVRKQVFAPALAGMAAEGRPYRGIVYAGLMLTAAGPKVLAFNCRFGDPETQVVLPLLETDLVEVSEAIVDGQLDRTPVRWREQAAVCVVMTAKGYPGDYLRGDVISGLDAGTEDSVVFHAGTAREGNRLVTSGGRVLGVTGLAGTLAQARERAYARVREIAFAGASYRSDIAARALPGVGSE